MATGDIAYNTLDSLSAFWPGLQVLAGDVENAIKSHMLCERRLKLSVLSTDYF
jgi:ER degradation enhancer, mannosidase alpha-like 1